MAQPQQHPQHKQQTRPPQHQARQPGHEDEMVPQPRSQMRAYKAAAEWG